MGINNSQNGLKRVDCMGVLNSLSLDERQFEWATFLCKIGNSQDFVEAYHESASPELAIMKFRKQLHKDSNNQINKIDMYEAFNNQQYEKLHRMLQDLFLEVIIKEDFDHTLLCINENCENLKDICTIQDRDKGLKLKKVLLIHSLS